jgi:hypothetical protein
MVVFQLLFGLFTLLHGALDCTPTIDGIDFDFSALRQSSSDYSGTGGGSTYKLNFCGNAVDKACSDKGGCLCEYDDRSNIVAVLASWSKAPEPQWNLADSKDASGGVTLTFENGDSCTPTRNSLISFICSDEASSTFIVSSTSKCIYTLSFNTPAACASDGLSLGSKILIFSGVAFIVYVAAGCVYKTKVKGTTGIESCPNVEGWRELPSLVWLGLKTTYHWIRDKLRGHASNNSIVYQSRKLSGLIAGLE